MWEGPTQTDVGRSDGILKTRRGRLRSQIRALHRVATEQHLMDGVTRQAGRVAGARVAAGDAEHTLRQQFLDPVINVAGLPAVAQTGGQALGQAITPVGCFQRDRSPVGTALPLVKLG